MTRKGRLSAASFRGQAPQPGVVEDDEIDLSTIFATLWRGKWFITTLTAMAVLIGGYYAYVVATPIYRATAVVILETDQDQIVDLQSVASGLSGDTSEINSQLEVLRARGLMGKVVDRLHLVKDPEFNTALRDPSFRTKVKTVVKERLGISTAPPVNGSEEQATKRTRDAVISTLLAKTSVSNVRQSLVFRVTAETEQPAKSAQIADMIVALYILDQIEVKFEATEQATLWLSGRVQELQTSLEEAEAKVSEFSAATDLVSIDGLRALERQIKEQRDRIDAAIENRLTLDQRLTAAAAAQTRAERADILDDPQLTRLLQRAETDGTIATSFDARADIILARLRSDLVRADQQLTALENSETDLESQIAQQGEDLITLQQLTREAEAVRSLYQYFLTRLKETSAQQGIQQADGRVLSDAVVPNLPSAPRASRILALSGILGLVLGAGLILLREMRHNSFRTARALEAATGYIVLGQIPTMPVSARRKVLQYLSDKPTSVAAEAVRNLRTSLLLSHADTPPQVIVSTSSVPGEGKTTNALALAQNLFGLGKKVLLIEGDIRRRTFHEYFGNLPEKGIISVLSGEQTLAQAVYKAPDFGVDILGGETSRTSAADIFASDTFADLITQARADYDVIIIDTPPVLVVPDARIIAEHADAIMFTVQWDKTSKPQVEDALRMFHNSGQQISGLVLSQISARGMKRYGYDAYSGYGAKYHVN